MRRDLAKELGSVPSAVYGDRATLTGKISSHFLRLYTEVHWVWMSRGLSAATRPNQEDLVRVGPGRRAEMRMKDKGRASRLGDRKGRKGGAGSLSLPVNQAPYAYRDFTRVCRPQVVRREPFTRKNKPTLR
jgi:hypothetical protein